MANSEQPSLKLRTARTLKWNTIDRLSSQVLYAVTGVVLANLLSKEDFGLVGALLVFQAFGILFVDSGFGSALLQKKRATRSDYSTVFWFNLAVSLTVYAALFLCAPLIADIFQGDTRLIPLSRIMFLSFILNGLGLVQTTRLMKEMNVRGIAVANIIALTLSGIVGVVLALRGAGAWALVWQTVSNAAVKSGWLWVTGHWWPELRFSTGSLRQIWRLGLSVFSSSALNTFFLYVYSFVIGAFYSLTALGVYTQADKWSKMGSASISQVLTASFVPLLAKFQDDGENFRRYVSKINRFTGFILFPALVGLTLIGTPVFHLLFGTKWDAAIPLFQILCIRGVFVVLISLYTNYLLSLGYGKKLMLVEIIKDGMIFLAIIATVWQRSVELLVWGQLGASAATYVAVLLISSRSTGVGVRRMLKDLLPYVGASMVMTCGCLLCLHIETLMPGLDIHIRAFITLLATTAAGAVIYCLTVGASGRTELTEARAYLLGRFRKNTG